MRSLQIPFQRQPVELADMLILILSMVPIPPLAVAIYFLFFSEQEQLDVDEEMRRLGVSRKASENRPRIDNDPEHFERVKQAVRLEVTGGTHGFSFHRWLEEHGILDQAAVERIEYGIITAMALGAVALAVTLGIAVDPYWLFPGFLWGAVLGLGAYFAMLHVQFQHTQALIRHGIPFLIEEMIIAMERTRDVWAALGAIADIYRRRGTKNPVALLLIQGYQEGKRTGRLEEALKRRAKQTAMPGMSHFVSALSRLQRHGASYEVELRMISDEALAKIDQQPFYLVAMPYSLEERCRYSGLDITPGLYSTAQMILTVITGLLGYFFFSGNILPVLTAAIFAAMAYVGCSLALDFVVKKRANQLMEELPLMLTYLQQQSRQSMHVMKALLQSQQVLKPHGALASELALMEARIRNGMHEEDALFRLGETYAVPELSYVVHALSLHRQTGGGLSQILERIQRACNQKALRIQSS